MTQMAFLFPGQGSQSIGMLADLASHHPHIRQRFDEASELVGRDLWTLTQSGPVDQLNQTENTQVIMLVADVAVFETIQSLAQPPISQMAGHSLGEYPALVCAGALTFADAVLLVQERARLMQSTIPLGMGAMAAIVGLDDETVQDLCTTASDTDTRVMPANYNAPGQVVIAGHSAAVDRAISIAEEKGARLAQRLAVSVPCHCDLLRDTAIHFAEALAQTVFLMPSIPVYSNVTAKPYEDVMQIKARLAEQLYSPVRWVEIIQAMSQAGVTRMVECGAGRVLAGLGKRIDRSVQVQSVHDTASLAAFIELLEEQSHA